MGGVRLALYKATSVLTFLILGKEIKLPFQGILIRPW
jgi:hypothetical protein